MLQVPVTATFGLLGLVACFSIAYDLGKHLGQEAVVSATLATVVFLLLQIDLKTSVYYPFARAAEHRRMRVSDV